MAQSNLLPFNWSEATACLKEINPLKAWFVQQVEELKIKASNLEFCVNLTDWFYLFIYLNLQNQIHIGDCWDEMHKSPSSVTAHLLYTPACLFEAWLWVMVDACHACWVSGCREKRICFLNLICNRWGISFYSKILRLVRVWLSPPHWTIHVLRG